MPRIEYVGKPVVAEDWQTALVSAVSEKLADSVVLEPTEELRYLTLVPWEIRRIPKLHAAHFAEFKAAMDELRMAEPEEHPVPTTRVIVRSPGRIYLGLANDRALNEERNSFYRIIKQVLGVDEEPQPKYNNVLLGRMKSKSPDGHIKIIETLTDHAKPPRIKLGKIVVGMVTGSGQHAEI